MHIPRISAHRDGSRPEGRFYFLRIPGGTVADGRAGVTGPAFRDLRVVRLALVETTVPPVTGHNLKEVEAVLDAHYPGRDLRLAEAAVLKLERRTRLQTEVQTAAVFAPAKS